MGVQGAWRFLLRIWSLPTHSVEFVSSLDRQCAVGHDGLSDSGQKTLFSEFILEALLHSLEKESSTGK